MPFFKIFVVFFAVALVSCSRSSSSDGGGGTSATDSCNLLPVLGSANAAFTATPGIFTYSPLDTSTEINYIAPLGNLNAPGHVFPSDHVYLYMKGATTAGAKNVRAPVGGTVAYINSVDHGNGFSDDAIFVKVDQSFWWFVGHVTRVAGLLAGSTVTANQVVATNSGWSTAIDFGVYNWNLPTNTKILNSCWRQAEGMTDKPLYYYSGSLSTTLYGLVSSATSDKDGPYGIDESGKLVGYWYHEGTSQFDMANGINFAYSTSGTLYATIVTGGGPGTLAAGSYFINSGDTDFKSVTSASGVTTYRLASTLNGATIGALLVQLVSDTRVKMEYLAGVSSGSFDANAVYYTR